MKVEKKDREKNKNRVQKSSGFSNFDDIIFENRNKEYGAYQLRKKYYSVVITGTILASVIMTLAVLIPFFASSKTNKVISVGNYYIPVQMQNLEPPDEKIFVPPAAPPAEPSKVQETVQYVPPVVVDSVPPVQLAQATVDEALEADKGNVMNAGSSLGDELLAGEGGKNTDEAFFQVEVMPSFRGGDLSKFREWVAKRTNYPQAAIDNKIRGTVFLTFIVEKDGSVSNVIVIKGVHPLLDNEAVKAISSSPKWTPGLQRGQPVRVRFQIPLSFIY
jgi:periplasmic protein TonB